MAFTIPIDAFTGAAPTSAQGLAGGFLQGLGGVNDVLKLMAMNKLKNQQAEQAFQREAELRKTLLAENLADREAGRAASAEQAQLNRELQERLAKMNIAARRADREDRDKPYRNLRDVQGALALSGVKPEQTKFFKDLDAVVKTQEFSAEQKALIDSINQVNNADRYTASAEFTDRFDKAQRRAIERARLIEDPKKRNQQYRAIGVYDELARFQAGLDKPGLLDLLIGVLTAPQQRAQLGMPIVAQAPASQPPINYPMFAR